MSGPWYVNVNDDVVDGQLVRRDSTSPTGWSAVDAATAVGTVVVDKGAWAPSTVYGVHNLVRYGGTTWICATAHTSGSVFDETKWTEMSQFRGAWAASTRYKTGDEVISSGAAYAATNTHTSGFTFAGDLSAHWIALSAVGPSGSETVVPDVDGNMTWDVTKLFHVFDPTLGDHPTDTPTIVSPTVIPGQVHYFSLNPPGPYLVQDIEADFLVVLDPREPGGYGDDTGPVSINGRSITVVGFSPGDSDPNLWIEEGYPLTTQTFTVGTDAGYEWGTDWSGECKITLTPFGATVAAALNYAPADPFNFSDFIGHGVAEFATFDPPLPLSESQYEWVSIQVAHPDLPNQGDVLVMAQITSQVGIIGQTVVGPLRDKANGDLYDPAQLEGCTGVFFFMNATFSYAGVSD